MSAWKQARLDDCCEIVAGATPSTSVEAYWDGDICWATPKDLSDLDGALISDTPRKLTRAGLNACAASILPAGSVLFSSRAPIGLVAVNTVPMATNQGFKSFVPKPEHVHAKFLYWWLRSHRSHLESLGNGATFKEVSKTVVSRFEIRLPPLTEQRRIAAILDQADALRAKRRAGLAQLDTLTQAIFLDLFGDPVRNDKDWKRFQLRDVCDNITDGTHDTPVRVASGIPFITSKNVRAFEIDLSDLEFVTPETHREIIKRCNPRPLDVLYTNIGVNVGNAAANRLSFEFSLKNVALIQPDLTKLDSFFLEALLNHEPFKQSILNVSSIGGAQKFISLNVLRCVQIVLPPVPLQREFARRVAAVEKLKTAHRASLAELNALFAALQHRAFRGEL